MSITDYESSAAARPGRGLAAEMLTDLLRTPFIIALLALASLLIHLSASQTLLQLDRIALEGGQWYRLMTCHLTHWTFEHLFWDVAVFAIAGALCELRSRKKLIGCLLGAGALIPLAIYLLQPELISYRGLSGIDAALVALLLTDLFIETLKKCHWFGMLMTLSIGGAFVVKTVVELTTGTAFFVDRGHQEFMPVPLAHLVGAIIGILAAIPWRRFRIVGFTPLADKESNRRPAARSAAYAKAVEENVP
jgi:rhomboid family GlyGly-CTERM serine protease